MRPRLRPRYFYGWNIVGASFLAHIAYAEGNSSILGLYFNPLHREFGWSRTVVAGVQTVNRLLEGLISPLVGPTLDRHGPRALMIAGGVVASLAFIMLSQVNALWQLYILRGAIIALAFALMGGFVSNVCVSNWFVRRRGRAIGLANMGSQAGNLILVPLVVWIISTWGWRSSFLLFASLPMFLVVVPAALIMRRRPEDMGLLPDGDSNAEPQKPVQNTGAVSTQRAADTLLQEPVWTRLEAMRTAPFWLIVASFSLSSLAVQGINFSLAPYAQDLGFGASIVATILIVKAAGQFTTLPVWGLIMDKADSPIVRILPLGLQAVACVFFLIALSQPGFVWLAVVAYGTSMSGIGVTQEVLWANYFGRRSLGTVRSTANPFLVALGSIGPLLMNKLFDISGSYRIAFLLFIGIFLFSSFLLWACRPPSLPRQRT
ncbi:MAG: MFS transporter [Dehalococcoidia bacterium]|nr:MFS transporter [Dehalococcoidia bacterium]